MGTKINANRSLTLEEQLAFDELAIAALKLRAAQAKAEFEDEQKKQAALETQQAATT